MLCLSGFELYSRLVPLKNHTDLTTANISRLHGATIVLHVGRYVSFHGSRKSNFHPNIA